ncbi:MFS transporter [uncultured Amnibacterium sp.]|uniref:MFS transporter n=1 Tax=uncultured Amnibacterium sp. TaxID=1631851 RepID=UPI0035CA27A5
MKEILRPRSKISFRTESLALAACALAGFATLVDQFVIVYAVPSLDAAFGAPTEAVQWFLAVYSLAFGIGLVPGGRLGDAHGRTGLFVGGLALFLGGGLLTLTSVSIGWAITGRAVQGLGAGLISAQVLGIIQDRFLGRDRVRALAVYGIAASASAVVGPIVAGVLLEVVPGPQAWRLLLAVAMPFVVATAVLALRSAPRARPRPAGRVRLDLPGVLLTALLVLLLTVPVVDGSLPAAARWAVRGAALGAGVLLLVWELRQHRRGHRPLFDAALVTSGGFVSGNLRALLWFGAASAQGAILTVFLLETTELPAPVVALVLVPGALARLAGSVLSLATHDLAGRWTQSVCLLIETAGGMLLVAAAGWSTGPVVVTVLVVQVVIGFCSGVFEPILRSTTLAAVPAGAAGVGASFLQLSQRLSATFCVAWVTGIAFTRGVDGIDVAGTRGGLAVCAGLLAVATAEAVRRALVHPSVERGVAGAPAASPASGT